ncbi:hypothetical protein GQ600_17847 [Phytophthora cactorum]|nr:hypothetical protein GQ600_17847 [Phytophthora cactorum]
MLARMAREWSVFMRQPVLPRHSKNPNSCLRQVTLLRAMLVAVVIFVCWGYTQLLVRYGSISPAATALFTTAYDGRAADDLPPTSPLWRPPFRVVVSLTTTPSRLDKVMNSVSSLTKQSLVPDQIYINIPEGPMKRHPERSYDETEIPSDLVALTPLVKVNRCVDDGPATKLLGALRLEHNASTLIITLDDDFEYPPELVASLAWEAVAKPDDALGVLRQRVSTRIFTDVEALADIPAVCVTVDDVWIAGYLRTVEQRHSALISKRLDPSDPEWKKEEARSSERQMTLSSFNHEHQVHYKCVQALEERFQRRWTRNFEE